MHDVVEPCEKLHAKFKRALSNDSAPATTVANCLYECREFNRDSQVPSARSRGTAFLVYLNGSSKVKDVPGQQFPEDQLLSSVCQALIGENIRRQRTRT